MRIYFSRHGESQANRMHEISNRGLCHPLTRTGRAQAHALAERLRETPVSYIYSSPTLRALETTIILANQLEVDYEVVDALREFDCGEAEGRNDEAAWAQWHAVVDAWLNHADYDQCIPGGESFNDLRRRFVPFIQGLVRRYYDTDTSLLCLAHGGLYLAMLPQVLVNVDHELIARLHIRYTSRIACEPRPDGQVCVEWDGVALDR